MLNFFPAIQPWSYLYTDMKSQIPVGTFYLYATHLLPRSVKPNEFWLVTDYFDTITISINDKVMGQLRPRARVQRVFLSLYEPPTPNLIKVENGVDAPVYLKVVVTHVAKEIEVAARELYTVAGRQVEEYADLLSSPWTNFILDYQLPWRSKLPNIRSLRILANKIVGNVLFGPGGSEGYVQDLVTAFSCSTPVVTEPKNPQEWQPDVYQPLTSGYDVAGFDFHVWFTNPCLVKWAAFLKLQQNTKSYDLLKVHEDALTIAPHDTDFYEHHQTNNLRAGCTVLDELISLGCMDGLVAVGILNFKSQPSLCAYAEPFDMVVEAPGIGGRFFDSGPEFDAFPIVTETVTVPAIAPFEAQLAHVPLPLTPGGYGSATLVDLTTSTTLTPVAPPPPPPVTLPASVTVPDTGLLTFDAAEAGNQVRVDYSYTVLLDDIYDIDLLTDYWVGTSTVKRFDFGKCLDGYPTTCVAPENANCCTDAPDVVLMQALDCQSVVVSPVTPNNPLFGGDNPGILMNPYFDLLA
jgi:hypothetical protein